MGQFVEWSGELLRFEGRIPRTLYWRRSLLLGVLLAVVWILGIFAIQGLGAAGAVIFSVGLPLLVASVANLVRRLHDRNRAWPWLLLFLVGPWVALGLANWLGSSGAGVLAVIPALAGMALNIWALVEIGFRRGTPGANRFGPAPV
jgi:uncharacterized membrane protein YhaH (DUF805 family)